MDTQKVDLFLGVNSDKFEATSLPTIKEKLQNLSDEKFMIIQSMELKKPSTVLILSIFLGGFGVDRFVLKDTGMGVLKLLTCGVAGILTIIDWFTATRRTKEYNYNLFMEKIGII